MEILLSSLTDFSFNLNQLTLSVSLSIFHGLVMSFYQRVFVDKEYQPRSQRQIHFLSMDDWNKIKAKKLTKEELEISQIEEMIQSIPNKDTSGSMKYKQPRILQQGLLPQIIRNKDKKKLTCSWMIQQKIDQRQLQQMESTNGLKIEETIHQFKMPNIINPKKWNEAMNKRLQQQQ